MQGLLNRRPGELELPQVVVWQMAVEVQGAWDAAKSLRAYCGAPINTFVHPVTREVVPLTHDALLPFIYCPNRSRMPIDLLAINLGFVLRPEALPLPYGQYELEFFDKLWNTLVRKEASRIRRALTTFVVE